MYHLHRVQNQVRRGLNYYQLCRCGAGRVQRIGIARPGSFGAVSPVSPGWPVPESGVPRSPWVPGPFPEAEETPVQPPRGPAGVAWARPMPTRTFKDDGLIPLEAHVLAAQIEDDLWVWQQRAGAGFRPDTDMAGYRAARRYGLMMEVIDRAKTELEKELGDYRRMAKENQS